MGGSHSLWDEIQCWCRKHLALSSWVSPPPTPHFITRALQGSSTLLAVLYIILVLSIHLHKQRPLLGTSFLPSPPGLFHSPFRHWLSPTPGKPACTCQVVPGASAPALYHLGSCALTSSHLPDQDAVWHLFLTPNRKPCLRYSLNKGSFLTNWH